MRLFLEPEDFLFFRDNRPFVSGESFAATSLDLPLPTVTYGAIRSYLLGASGIDFGAYAQLTDANSLNTACQSFPLLKAMGGPGTALPGSLKVRGPYFASLNHHDEKLRDVFFPQPLDLVAYKSQANNSGYTILKPGTASNSTNLPLPCKQLLQAPAGLKLDDKATPVYVKRDGVGEYLAGNVPSYTGTVGGELVESSHIFASEFRYGIAITPEYVTDKGMLYSLEGRRLHQNFNQGLYGLVLELEDANLKLNQLDLANRPFFIGGERRFARLVVLDDDTAPIASFAPDPLPAADFGDTFKLYLATPALFNNGWLPGWLDSQTGIGHPPHDPTLQVKLITAAVGRPIIFSGFDMALGRPKPIQQAVPAGSVYYFKLLAGTPDQVLNAFHNHSISEQASQAGFGVAFVGHDPS